MKEFDRERAHRRAQDLSHLKDEPDEKNTEHIERVRQGEHDKGEHDKGRPGQKAGAPPQEPPGD